MMKTTPNQAIDRLIEKYGMNVCQNHKQVSDLYFHLLDLKFEFGGKQLFEINNEEWKELLKLEGRSHHE